MRHHPPFHSAAAPATPVADGMVGHSLPEGSGHRLFLFAMRRMAVAGVNDAHAANALFGAFGKSYRRPLVLMRAMMLEIARSSARKIIVAPCCCVRMTADEASLMLAVADALEDIPGAHRRISALMGMESALGAFTCIQAVAQAFADLGRPLELYAPT
jgi:hypothetical protein